jgi:hypothetical protein
MEAGLPLTPQQSVSSIERRNSSNKKHTSESSTYIGIKILTVVMKQKTKYGYGELNCLYEISALFSTAVKASRCLLIARNWQHTVNYNYSVTTVNSNMTQSKSVNH